MSNGFDLTDNSVVLPGRIVSFDAGLQLAEVKISMDSIWSSSQQNPTTSERTHAFGVPVHFPQGGNYCITFPVAAGDPCLLVFSQMGYDHWLYENKDLGGMLEDNPVPHLRRNFDEEDGFCILFKNRPTAISNYSDADAEFRSNDRTQFISIKADGTIEIETPTEVGIKAPTIAIEGNLTVSGTVVTQSTITASGDVVGAGISLSLHTHSGVTTGPGNTAPPN